MRRASHALRRRAAAAALCALLAGCGAPPAPPPPQPAPPQPQLQPEDQGASRHLVTVLPNGLGTFATTAPAGASAQLQIGVLAGALFEAPGLAELAAVTLVRSSNPASGQPSLEQAVRRIGGTVDVRIGLMTTWLDIRVPTGKLPAAAKALRAALESPTTSRHLIDRLRDELVAEKAQAALADPIDAMSRVTLLAERSTASYIDGLLDIDASQVDLFHSRMYRPDRCLLSVSWAQTHGSILKMLGEEGSLAGWTAGPAVPGDISLLQRSFASRLLWNEQGAPGAPAKVAVVLPLPQQTDRLAAGLLVMHACLTLDGTGGRFERLQDEAGLGHLQWEARYARAPDSHALVLTTTATAAEAARLWRLLEDARRSLVDVPPSPSELQLALRRARLNAGLPLLEDHSRLRVTANLTLAGMPTDVVERQLDALAAAPTDYAGFAAAYLQKPCWMVVTGPPRPDGVAGLEPFTPLPPGFELPQGVDEAAVAAPTDDPWIDRARAATGLPRDFERLDGFDATAERAPLLAPAVTEKLSWRRDGRLVRERTVLGEVVTTSLEGDSGRETLAGVSKGLPFEEVEALRRELRRHPLMLLAAVGDGALRFRPIAQREVGDRELMVMEAVQEGASRLRLHIDVRSHLIRVVESWDEIGESVVHVREEWSDYRRVGTLRVPHRCDVTWNDGEHRARLTYTSWQPVTR